MNDLRALIDDATSEGVPGFDAVLARRDQRTRRRRVMIAGAGAAVLVVAASLATQLGRSDGDPSPAPAPTISPTESSSPTPTVIDRPDPTYTWSDTPSRVVLRTPERDVRLTTWLGCWYGPSGNLDCVEEDAGPVAELPDVGSPEFVEFWFGVKGWTFTASFTQLGNNCPRSEDTKTVSTGDHWFRLKPAGLAGDYQVDLIGYGPHSEFKGAPTMMSFVWHTPVDGPVDQPRARVSVSDLDVSDIGFQPASATAQVRITDVNGETTTRRLPRNGGISDCESGQGGLYFQGDFDDPAIPELGPSPYSYRVRLTLDGETYVGTATSNDVAFGDARGVGPGTSANVVVWSPPLPAYTG